MPFLPGVESRPYLAEDGPPVLSPEDRHAARLLNHRLRRGRFVHATAAGGRKAEVAEKAERICGGGHGGSQETRTGTDKMKINPSLGAWELFFQLNF